MEIVEQQITTKKRGSFKKAFGTVFGNKGRKVMLLTGLLALLVVTGYLNFKLNQNAIDVNGGLNADSEQTNLFKMFKDNRVDARASRKLILEDLIASSASTAEAKASAEAELLLLEKEIAFETKAESDILMQCGFADVVVSKSDANINVLVKTTGVLQQQQVNKICAILDVCNGEEVLNLSKVFISEIE
ncbi:MAG: SpoIIIAH-like family protein [Christensenellaceae bacterium]|nr:SpoIIIAH-like family protein [Christensenellaceae bacterium]